MSIQTEKFNLGKTEKENQFIKPYYEVKRAFIKTVFPRQFYNFIKYKVNYFYNPFPEKNMKLLHSFVCLLMILGLFAATAQSKSAEVSQCNQRCEKSYKQCSLSCNKDGRNLCNVCSIIKNACVYTCEHPKESLMHHY